MEIAIFWVGGMIIVGVLAKRRGRSWLLWAFIALFLSPLLAGLLVLALGYAGRIDTDAPTAATHARCPECKELVRRDAKKCRHCGAALPG
jgi:hypothetical protein